MVDSNSFKGGLDLKFVADPKFESLDKADSSEHAAIIGRNALRLIMMGWPAESWTQLLTWDVLKTVLLQRDPALLKEFRLAFQQGFETLFTQLHGAILTKEQHEQVQLYLSNCLSHLPYSDLTPYESIRIPQYIDDQWVLVDYYVNPIELTEEGKKKDHDRVFAYGLEPIANQKASPHLIFMGTTYPAGQGFLPQITTDFEAFETVGTALYLSGRERIHDWLLRQHSKVHVCGGSLGGSLSLLLAIDLGNYLSRVDAFNPAGLHHMGAKNKYDNWDTLITKPQVVIQQQGDDPVSLLGFWKSDWEILQVTPPVDKKGPNPFCDHFMNYAGFADTEFTYITPEHQNVKNKTRSLLFYTIGRSAIYYFLISPYNHVLRPVKYHIEENRMPYFIMLTALLGIAVFVGFALANILSPFIVFGAFALWGISSGLLFTPSLVNALIPGTIVEQTGLDEVTEYAKLHDPTLPRNPEMDIYNKEQTIEVELTYRELHKYYKAKRCLVKDKEFVPSHEKTLKGTDLLKKEVLAQSQNPENNDKLVTLKTTKAKAVQIKHVLTFIDQLGSENEQKLKQAIESDYNHYLIGKYPGS